jgi:hypothetical protein
MPNRTPFLDQASESLTVLQPRLGENPLSPTEPSSVHNLHIAEPSSDSQAEPMFSKPSLAGSSSPPPRANIRCAHASCTFAVNPDETISANSCCKKCEGQLEQGGEPKHGKRCVMAFPAGAETCQRPASQAAASHRTAHGDGMVGLHTQASNPDNNETHTRGAKSPIGRVCEAKSIKDENLGIVCGKAINYLSMQVMRDSKAICIECFNEIYAEKEFPGHGPYTSKQFQRLSHAEHMAVMQKMDPDTVKLTKRAAQNPTRSPGEVEQALAKLDKQQTKVLRSSTDYLANIGRGFQGWYVCASKQHILPDNKILRIKAAGTGDEGWRQPLPSEIQQCKAMTCSSVILPMNHWFKGGTSKKYRCPINGCQYHVWSQNEGDSCNFFVVLYDEEGKQWFIPAVPPKGKTERLVAFLKLMFAEENLAALMSDAADIEDYWAIINAICKSEFATLSEYDRSRIRGPPRTGLGRPNSRSSRIRGPRIRFGFAHFRNL